MSTPNGPGAAVRELTYCEAVREAIAEEMRRDPTVFVIGEDVAEAGHPFIGTRPDLLYQRDYFTAVIDYAARARKEGRSREELAKVEVLPRFETAGRRIAP